MAESNTTYGAVIAKLKGHQGDMPPYVHLGGKLFGRPTVGGGALGSAFDPVEIRDPTGTKVQLPQFTLSADVPAERLPVPPRPVGLPRPHALEG